MEHGNEVLIPGGAASGDVPLSKSDDVEKAENDLVS